MIVFEDVSFAYATSEGARPALGGVSFAVAPGERVAVVGANGSGKSTLARLADGLLLPSRGRVLVDGMDTRDAAIEWDVRARVGVVFQHPDDQIVGTVVEEDVAFGPENLCVPAEELRRRVDAALAAVGLTGLERREPHLLSEGQKQRLAIAGALAMRPAYLVLDEPTAMLDPEGRSDVLRVLDALVAAGHGVLHITHDLSEAARADRVVALSGGMLSYDGPPEGLLGDVGRLDGLGLALPAAGLLGAGLRSMGARIPVSAMEADEIVEALWPSS